MFSGNTKYASLCIVLLVGTIALTITIITVILKPSVVNTVSSGGSQTVNNEMSLLNLEMVSNEDSTNESDHTHTNFYIWIAVFVGITLLLKTYIIKTCLNNRCTKKATHEQDIEMNQPHKNRPTPSLALPPPPTLPPHYNDQADYSHLLPYLVGELACIQEALGTSHVTPV